MKYLRNSFVDSILFSTLFLKLVSLPDKPKSCFLPKSSENAPQLAAGMNRRVGWQAASLGAAKQIRATEMQEFAPQIPHSLLWGDSFVFICKGVAWGMNLSK